MDLQFKSMELKLILFNQRSADNCPKNGQVVENILFFEKYEKVGETIENIRNNLDSIPNRTKEFVMMPVLASKEVGKNSKGESLYYAHWIVLLISGSKSCNFKIFDPTLQASKQIIDQTDNDKTPYSVGDFALPYSNDCYVNNKQTQALTEKSTVCGFQVADFIICVNSNSAITKIEQVVENIESIRAYIKDKTLNLIPRNGEKFTDQLPNECDNVILLEQKQNLEQETTNQQSDEQKQINTNKVARLQGNAKGISKTNNISQQTIIKSLRRVFGNNSRGINSSKALKGYQERQIKVRIINNITADNGNEDRTNYCYI